MKKIISILLLSFSVVFVHAQGTFDFAVFLNGGNEVPPTSSTRTGIGSLTLNGSDLDYTLNFSATLDTPTDVSIFGPAAPGSTAPLLFDLGAPSFISPNPPQYPWFVTGTINNLTGGQIDDLMAGHWYVNLFSSSSTYPNGENRGQIMPVPEPSAFALLGTSAVALLIWRRKVNYRG
jgi:hypothetical protein